MWKQTYTFVVNFIIIRTGHCDSSEMYSVCARGLNALALALADEFTLGLGYI